MVLIVWGVLNIFSVEVWRNSVIVNVTSPSLPVCSLFSSWLLMLKIVTFALVNAEPVLLLTLAYKFHCTVSVPDVAASKLILYLLNVRLINVVLESCIRIWLELMDAAMLSWVTVLLLLVRKK